MIVSHPLARNFGAPATGLFRGGAPLRFRVNFVNFAIGGTRPA